MHFNSTQNALLCFHRDNGYANREHVTMCCTVIRDVVCLVFLLASLPILQTTKSIVYEPPRSFIIPVY
jgi:hypothetical protein